MKHTSIKQRLLVLGLMPVLVITILASQLLVGAWRNLQSAHETRAAIRLAAGAGELIHTLQAERGVTAGYLQAKGKTFSEKLADLRQQTDRAALALQADATAANLGAMPTFAKALQTTQQALASLPQIRGLADQQTISVAAEVDAYSRQIDSLIALIAASEQYSSDPAITRETTAYLALVRAKESAGLERALVTSALTDNALDIYQFQKMLDLVSRQQTYLSLFQSNASPASVDDLKTAQTSPPFAKVREIRKVLLEKSASGNFGIEASTWFLQASERINALHALEGALTRRIDLASEDIVTHSMRALWGYTLLVLASILVVTMSSLWVAAGVSNPLQAKVKVTANAIRDNDFSKDVPEAGPREVMQTGRAFNQLMGVFRDVIAEMKTSSGQITDAASDLASSSLQVKQSSEAQSDAAATVAAAVEQASVTVSETSAQAHEAAESVAQAQRETTSAISVMGEAVGSMREIATLIASSSSRVTALNESSHKIGGIIQLIREIAGQTSLLALNAAIEAARAGEQGRGFAVVADEVRKLSERTSQATVEISGLILGIREGISGTFTSMEAANEQACSSLQLVGRTETALARIEAGSKEVANNVFSISNALSEQDESIRQVAVSIERIAQMTEQNSITAESNNRTAHALDLLANHLRTSVSRFKV